MKILSWALALVLAVSLTLGGFWVWRTQSLLTQQVSALKQEIVSQSTRTAETQLLTARRWRQELSSFSKDLQALKSALEKGGRKVVSSSKAVILLPEVKKQERGTSFAIEGGKLHRKMITGEEGLPLADVTLNSKTEEWSWTAQPLRVKIQILQSKSPDPKALDGLGVSASLVGSDGKERKARLVELTTKHLIPEKKWNWKFDPRIEFTLIGALTNSSEGVFGAVASTHLFKLRNGDQTIMKFLGVGLGGGVGPAASPQGLAVFIPLSWNIGSVVPILQNTSISILGGVHFNQQRAGAFVGLGLNLEL